MKLEIKHLAPYLAYGLKYVDKDTKEIKTMRSVSTEINMIDFGWGNAHELTEFKPILRPMSDLSSDFMFNLFEMIDESDWIELNGLDLENLHFQIDDKWNYVLEIDESLEFHFSNNSFGLYSVDDHEALFINNQFELMQKLFECHFDVFGLIDEGLATNINDLN